MKNQPKGTKSAANQPKAKPANPNTSPKDEESIIKQVYNLIILDESGSMSSCAGASVAGFNQTIQTIASAHKEDSQREQLVSFVTFNTESVKKHNWCEPISQIKKMSLKSFKPNGSTPLLDTIGIMVSKLEQDIISKSQYIVLVTIITDGYENASTLYTVGNIQKLISRLKEGNWVFTYIGANQNAEEVACSLSIDNSVGFESDEEGSKQMYSNVNESRTMFYNKIKESASIADLKKGFFESETES